MVTAALKAKQKPLDRSARRLAQAIPRAILFGLAWLIWATVGSPVGNLAVAEPQVTTPYPGIEFRKEVRYRPRLIRFFLLRVDLTNPRLLCDVAVATDRRSKEGPRIILEDPTRLAREFGMLAAVNANPFGLTPIETEAKSTSTGIPLKDRSAVTICGWVKMRRGMISQPSPRFWSFWITPEGTPEVGNPASPPEALVAVAGFGPLILEGKIVASAGGPLDRRTALGFDRNRSSLLLMVVDGKQPGWSEGVTYGEVADLLLEAGAFWAIQLDGGSSSVMLLRGPSGEMEVVNRPPDLAGVRPVPVLLGIRPAP